VIEGILRTPAAPSIWDVHGTAVLCIDERLFPADAALAAAYKFTDRCYVWLETAEERPGHFLLFLRPKAGAMDLAALSGEFTNELIDQRLRQRLNERFGDGRAIIAAQAFAEGNLLHPSSEADPQADPDGAARRR
jgi:His-Xaa-Ser system protein HxsD